MKFLVYSLVSLFIAVGVSAGQHDHGSHSFPKLNDAPEAKISIVVFADFERPYCKQALEAEERIIAEYGKDVEIIFRNMPLSQIHPNARSAALAGLCAHQQGQFKAMHDQLFANQKSLSQDLYGNLARDLKLDEEKFKSCMSSHHAQHMLEMDIADANSFKVSGTPTFFINSSSGTVRLNGAYPYEDIKKEIDKLLAQ